MLRRCTARLPRAARSFALVVSPRFTMSDAAMSTTATASPAPAEGGPVQQRIVSNLHKALSPLLHLEIENESYKHSVPKGSESHFKVFVVSPVFEGKSLLERHRMVNDAVKGGEAALPIHALSIQAKTPTQWQSGAGAALLHGLKSAELFVVQWLRHRTG